MGRLRRCRGVVVLGETGLRAVGLGGGLGICVGLGIESSTLCNQREERPQKPPLKSEPQTLPP